MQIRAELPESQNLKTREAFWMVGRGCERPDTTWWREMLLCLDSCFRARARVLAREALFLPLRVTWVLRRAGRSREDLRGGRGLNEGWARMILQSRKTRTESTKLPRACSSAGVTYCPYSQYIIIHHLKLFRDQHSTWGPKDLVSGCGSWSRFEQISYFIEASWSTFACEWSSSLLTDTK